MMAFRTCQLQRSFPRLTRLFFAWVSVWLVLAALNLPAAAQMPADWTQFHRDNMQRWNPYETVLGVSNVAGLKLKWAFATGTSTNQFEFSSPAIVNGVVYLSSINGNVYALNANTGTKLWSSPVYLGTSPVVEKGVLYVGSEDHNVYALNAATGAKLWSYLGTGGYTSPTMVNGILYIGSNDNAGILYALNASTGTLLWSQATGAPGNYDPLESSPAVANGVVYIGAYDGNVIAFNASTGAKLWSYATGAVVQSSPAVANGVVYIGSDDNKVYALNAATGVKLWSFSASNAVIGSPAVANGVVFIGALDGNMYALNAANGGKLWSYSAGSNNPLTAAPAVANGIVYFGATGGTQYALNASTGGKLWSYSTGDGYINPSPAVVNGILYGGSGVHYYAFALGGADLSLKILSSPTPVVHGQYLTYAFPIWNLGPVAASREVLTTQVPPGTAFSSIRLSGTPGLGTCTTPAMGSTGPVVCHENAEMATNTTWTVRLTVKVTAPAGTVITETGTATEDSADPNMANNTVTINNTVQ